MWREVSVSGLSRLVVGGVEEICRLCGTDATNGVALHEAGAVRSPCPPGTTLAEIIAVLTHRPLEESSVLPGVVCPACARAAVSSLAFLRLCSESERCWQKLCSDLSHCIEAKQLANPKVETAYVFIGSEKPKVLIDKQKVHSGVAFHRAQVLLRNEQNRIRARTKNELSGRSGSYYQCEDCGKLVKSIYLFQKHIAVHLQNLECSYCGKLCATKTRLNMHIARHHSKKKYKCPICNKKFGSKYLVSEHQNGIHQNNNCRVCGKIYASKSSLRAHEESHEKWTCYRCGKFYKYKQSLRAHICTNSDVPQEMFECAECGKRYSVKGSLRTHIQLEHIRNPHTCTICSKSFHSASRLRDHAAVHTGLKSHSCPFCKGAFMTRATLTRHVRTAHTGEKPYDCWECSASFVSSHRRTEHRRKCHGAPAPTCHVCQTRFSTHHDLRKHLRKHFEPANKLYCREVTAVVPACDITFVDAIEM